MKHEIYDRMSSLILELSSDEDPISDEEGGQAMDKVMRQLMQRLGMSGEPSPQQRTGLFKVLPQYLQAQKFGGSTVLGSVLSKARKTLGLDRSTIVKNVLN